MVPDRATAANWATELEKNGFAHHTAEKIKKSLQEEPEPTLLLAEQESFGAAGSAQFMGLPHNPGPFSYNRSSQEDR